MQSIKEKLAENMRNGEVQNKKWAESWSVDVSEKCEDESKVNICC